MTVLRAVLRKELATLWTSPVPWVAGAALQAVLAVLFVDQLQGRAQAVVQPLFPIAGLLLVVTVPVLAMRAFAEERRSGNLDVLLAAPVPVLPMTIAKWLAAWLTTLAVLLPAVALAGLTALWGDPDLGPMTSGFVGLALLAAAVAAIGVLASAATSSQSLAALVAILGCLVLWFVGSATSGSSTARVLGGFSLSERMRTFAAGGIDRADTAFFVGVAVVCVVGAAVVVRPAKLLALLAAGALAITVWASGEHTLTDLTDHETLTLTAITRDVVRAIDADVKVTAFVGRGNPGRVETVALLERYARLSRRVGVEVVDPGDAPGEVRRLGVDPVLGGVVVQRGDDIELAPGATEQDITSALARLLRGNDALLCLATGHGEVDITFPTYRTTPLDLLADPRVPDDCAVVVVAGPQTDIGPAGERALADWVRDDGKLLALLDPASDVTLERVLGPYGLATKRGVVFEGDPESIVNGDESSPIIRRYSSAHPVVRGLPPTYFPGVQEVIVDDSVAAPGLTVSRLADTSELSYLETKPLEPSFDPDEDSGGPITIAAAADESRVASDAIARTRVVVVGDVDFATSDFVDAAANARFLSQAIGWLALDDDLIPLSSNLPEDRPLDLTDARVAYARFLGVGAIPGLFLLGGAIVWAARRRR